MHMGLIQQLSKKNRGREKWNQKNSWSKKKKGGIAPLRYDKYDLSFAQEAIINDAKAPKISVFFI